MLGARPGNAELLDRFLRHQPEKLVREKAGQIRDRLGQADLQGVIIDRVDAKVFGPSLPFVVRLSTFDVVREVRGAGSKRGGEAAAHRVDKIARRNRVAV